jgi:uncharacterized iron-regulated membrane protein
MQKIVDTRRTIKKAFGTLHLVLGLSSGLVVVIIALTGAIWTFESELSDMVYSYRTVVPENRAYLPPAKLKALAAPHFQGKIISGYDYPGRQRAATLSAWGKHPDGKEYRIRAFMNPYTGAVLHVQSDHNFFDIVLDLHINLLLGEPGRYIVDFATLFFLFLLISGIVLWWPKNKAAAKQRFWLRWKKGLKWKRKNYDLHNVLGFYASWVAVFIALTGLAWGFEWMNKTIYYVATAGAEYKDWSNPVSTSDSTATAIQGVEDQVFYHAIAQYNKPYASINVYTPDTTDKKGAIVCYVNPSEKTFYRSANYYYDQRSGAPLLTEHFTDLNNGQKARSMYYDIHIGKILGLPGQILVFLASLIVASLPVTGFYIWWGRRKKAKNNTQRVPISMAQPNGGMAIPRMATEDSQEK